MTTPRRTLPPGSLGTQGEAEGETPATVWSVHGWMIGPFLFAVAVDLFAVFGHAERTMHGREAAVAAGFAVTAAVAVRAVARDRTSRTPVMLTTALITGWLASAILGAGPRGLSQLLYIPAALALAFYHSHRRRLADRTAAAAGGEQPGVQVARLDYRTPAPSATVAALAEEAVQPAQGDAVPMTLPVPEPFAVAFECSGHASAAEAALGQLDYAGTLVIVGTGFEPPRYNQNRMIIFELEIIGAYNYNDEGFQPAVDLLDTGTLPFEALIEPDNIPLSEVMVSMERLSRGEIPSKVMVQPGLSS